MMDSRLNTIPIGNISQYAEHTVQTSTDLGNLVRERRRALTLKQLDVAGLSNTGNRFIVELEQGKPTVQLQKVLDVLNLLGLELVVRTKAGVRQ